MALDIAKAKTSPSQVFSRPKDVLNEHDLTQDQKIEILHQWELDARQLSVAEEENMGGGEPNRLQEVVKCLIALGDENHISKKDDVGAAAGKHGDAPSIKPETNQPTRH